MRAPRTHHLKTHPIPFRAIVQLRKKAELRHNDRDYMEGDKLVLQEYDPITNQYSGLEIKADISHVIDVDQWRTPTTPRTGMVVLSLDNVDLDRAIPGN